MLDLPHTLPLTGMVEALEEQWGISDIASLTFKEHFALLVAREHTARENWWVTRLLQIARFRLAACVEDLNFRTKRGLDCALVMRLASGEWVAQHTTVLITRPTGTDKTFLACALGYAACRHSFFVCYLRLPRFLGELAVARGDGSYTKLMQTLAKTDLLLLGDWGLAPLGDRERRDLLEVIENCTSWQATLITSQLPLDHWHELVSDPTFGNAILDRLVH